MLDKLLLNNQILANKSAVRKVRVNLISKQVQKLRKLKKLKEKYPDCQKFERRIIKSTEVLDCLKKGKCSEILRNALLSEQNHRKVLTNILSTPEEVTQALYCLHDTIQLIVRNLKCVLHIDETDTSWREEVAEPSKRKRKQLRTEKKQQIRQERKAKKELDVKRNEWLVENLPEVDTENKNGSEDKPAAEETNSASQLGFVGEDAETDIKITKHKKNESRPRKATKEIRLPRSVSSESEEDKEAPVVQHAVDDFFLTASGDHYLSTVVIDRTEPERPNDGLVRKERRNMQAGKLRHTNNKRKFASDSRNGWKSKETKSYGSKGLITFERHSFATKKSNKSEGGEQIKKLHPSWAAKQKQKGIKSFQGTKVVFSDETSVQEKTVKQETASKEKLHPSWEAKQKLKPTIAEFKGKKIVFDD